MNFIRDDKPSRVFGLISLTLFILYFGGRLLQYVLAN